MKTNFRRALSGSVAIVLVLGMLLTGCNTTDTTTSVVPQNTSASNEGTEPTKEPVTLEFWYEGSGPARTEMFEGLIKQWNDNNPDITIKGTFLANDKAMDKINVAIAGEVTPDIVTLQPSWVGELFVQDLFVPLDEKFSAWDESEYFIPDFIDVLKAAHPEGKLLSIPQAANLYGLWYRADVYDQKGLASPTTSWDTMFSNFEKTTEKETNTFGHTIRGGTGSTVQLLYVLISYVGISEFFDDKGVAQILRSPEAVEFINLYSNVFKNGQAPQSSLTASFKEMAADLTSGVSMSYIHNLGSYETVGQAFSADQYGFAMYPKSPSTGNFTAVRPTVKSNAMFKSVKDEDAAWEFMKYWASTESDLTINKLVGELPIRIDTMQSDWVKSAPHLKQVIPFLEDSDKVSVRYPNYLPDFSSIMSQIGDPSFQAVLTDNMSAEEFLGKLADELEASFVEYNK